ncbi:MAG: AI-2E family transporter [Deltaproteobacteria bacterium]|nr:AI-2E family transporter [Deltaproteobacteria bacterium]
MKSEYLITLLLSLLIGYLMYLVMAPFFIPIFWAAVLTILFYPYYQWLLRKVTKRRPLASIIACITIAIFILIPLALIGAALANELFNLYQWSEGYLRGISEGQPPSPSRLMTYLEGLIGRYVDISGIDLHGILAGFAGDAASYAGEGLKGFIKNFTGFVFNIFLAFFTMYFLFKDGESLFTIIKDVIPLAQTDKDRIIEKNKAVITATINGGVLVGLVQGALGGIAFWFLSLPGPILWSFVMFLFSFLPTVGSAIIWVPAAIYLFVIGSYIKGTILVFWGIFVIGLADNVLRPFIVSGKTNLHPMLLLFSILGAVNVFGFIGIIAGPLILSIGQAMVEIYHEYIKNRNTWPG